MTSDVDVWDALMEARDLPDGDTKVDALERLVADADAAGDPEVGIQVRYDLIEAYSYHTEGWKMIPVFAWCLATYDRDPALFDEQDSELLRWYHKWAVATLLKTSRVSLPQTLAALSDMERRYLAGGHSLHAVYSLRCRIASHLGDEPEAREWFERWRTARRDENSDCAGCDPSRQAEYLTTWGRPEEAIEVVEPVLSGVLGCPEQPEKAMATALLPYLRTGRFEQAARAHVRAYRRHRYRREDFVFLPAHLTFCALTGNHERGLALLAEHLPWLSRPYDDYSAMEFSAAGALVARHAERAGAGGRRLPLPADIDRPAGDLGAAGDDRPSSAGQPGNGDRPAGIPTVAELGRQLAESALAMAARFDERNGTGQQSARIRAWLAEPMLIDHLDLPEDRPGYRPGGHPTGDAMPAGDEFAEVRAVIEVGPGAPESAGGEDLVAPLRQQMIVAALQERGDPYVVDGDSVTGRFDDTVIHFQQLGERGEILHVRSFAARRFPAEERAALYEFCNGWNHDRLLPKAYVHESHEGDLVVIGEASTDLEHGVAAVQLGVLIEAGIGGAVALTRAVDALQPAG